MGAGARVGRYAGGPGGGGGGGAKSGNTAEQQLNKICCDARKVALEQVKGISGQVGGVRIPLNPTPSCKSPAQPAVTPDHLSQELCALMPNTLHKVSTLDRPWCPKKCMKQRQCQCA